ncbi:hypothetical protein ACFX2J_040997 [Malus domestica]
MFKVEKFTIYDDRARGRDGDGESNKREEKGGDEEMDDRAVDLLSPEDLSKALEIVAQSDPGFQATADKVDLDIDAQTQSTLWRLKVFVKDAIQVQGKSPASMVSNTNTNNNSGNNKTNNNISNAITRRKREISDAIVKTTKKKSKKPSPS